VCSVLVFGCVGCRLVCVLLVDVVGVCCLGGGRGGEGGGNSRVRKEGSRRSCANAVGVHTNPVCSGVMVKGALQLGLTRVPAPSELWTNVVFLSLFKVCSIRSL